MNASLWQLAGWTMIHSLWLGAAVALAGGFLRVAARRAAPNVRYAISLATLAALAATPLAAAVWLSVNGVPQLAIAASDSVLLPLPPGEGWGEGQNPLATMPSANTPIENPSPSPSLQGRGTAGTPGRMPGLSGQVIDLAQATPTELEPLATQAQAAPPIPPSRPSPPSPPSDHQSPITSHLSPFIPHLPTLWLIGAPLTFTLLATGLVGSARLRRRATPLLAGSAYEACERLRQTLKITRRVALAVSDGVAQPILVGVLRPADPPPRRRARRLDPRAARHGAAPRARPRPPPRQPRQPAAANRRVDTLLSSRRLARQPPSPPRPRRMLRRRRHSPHRSAAPIRRAVGLDRRCTTRGTSPLARRGQRDGQPPPRRPHPPHTQHRGRTNAHHPPHLSRHAPPPPPSSPARFFTAARMRIPKIPLPRRSNRARPMRSPTRN
jgi:hypothetical protein